jgi:succinate dehydrogenase / fumarate reductase, cytochrome b subunit
MQSSSRSGRPLSPHLQVYRWQYTMALSILHRVTGCALSLGLLLLVYWLVALAGGQQSYADALVIFSHPVTKLVLAGLSFAFFYHLMNGVRHLTWDTGHGLERKSARTSGWVAFIGSVLLTAVFWMLVFNRIGEAA